MSVALRGEVGTVCGRHAGGGEVRRKKKRRNWTQQRQRRRALGTRRERVSTTAATPSTTRGPSSRPSALRLTQLTTAHDAGTGCRAGGFLQEKRNARRSHQRGDRASVEQVGGKGKAHAPVMEVTCMMLAQAPPLLSFWCRSWLAAQCDCARIRDSGAAHFALCSLLFLRSSPTRRSPRTVRRVLAWSNAPGHCRWGRRRALSRSFS